MHGNLRAKAYSRRKSRAVFGKVIREIWADYCEYTSLHGIKNMHRDLEYLSKPSTKEVYSKKYVLLGKMASVLLWGSMLVLGILLAVALTYLIYNRTLQTPTIITISDYSVPNYEVPFPAVSLCNINVVHRPAMEKVLQQFVMGGFNETAMRTAFDQLSYFVKLSSYAGNVTSEMQQFQMAMKQFDYTVESIMLKMMEPCSSFIKECSMINRNVSCAQIFIVSKTSEGLCCSFNYKLVFNYQAYTNENLSKLYGHRLSGDGEYNGLGVKVVTNVDSYVSTIRSTPGTILAVHNQEEYAEIIKSSILIPASSILNFIYANIIIADATVREIPISRRECQFEYENPPKFTDKYSLLSCLTDCRVRHYIKLCKCIPFYYPHLALPEYASIDQCSFEHLPCLYEIRRKIANINPPGNSNGLLVKENKTLVGIDCPECIPDCEHIRYDSVQTQSLSKGNGGRTKLNASTDYIDTGEIKNTNKMSLFVGYYSDGTVRCKRSVFMPGDILFANIGGTFGLCLGASLISLIEIVYFMVLRVIGRFYMEKPRQRVQPTSNEQQIMTIDQFYRTYYRNGRFDSLRQ